MLGALRIRDFRLLWAGQLLSTFGDWLIVIAVPLYVFAETGSVAATGLLYAAQNVPAVVVGPLGGVFADRWDRRRTMATVDMGRAALTATVAIVVAWSPAALWVVVGAVVAERLLAQFYDPSSAALVPCLVGTGEELAQANSAFASSAAMVRIAGAPIGGALYGLAGLGPLLALDAASFMISTGCVLALRHRSVRDVRHRERRVGKEFREGLSAIRTRPPVRWVVAVMAAFMLTNGAVSGLLVPYVNDQLDAGPVAFGAVLSSLGAGYLVGAAIAAQLGRRDPLYPVISAALGVVTAGFGLMFASGSTTLAIAGAFVAGVGGSVTLVCATTALQRSTSNHLLGRVSGVSNATQQAAQVAGAVIGVALAARLGLTRSLLAWSALLALLAGVAAGKRPSAPQQRDCPRLTNGKILLRFWRPDDAQAYIDGRDEAVFRWTTEDPELTVEVAEAAIHHYATEPHVFPFAIVDPTTDRPIGNLPVGIAGNRADVAYWLTPAARGHHVVADALDLVLDWLRSTGITAVELEVHPDNVASQRTATRAGFTPAGTRPSNATFAHDTGEVLVYEQNLT